MFVHATIPDLPPRLWQAAFYLDMLRQDLNAGKTREALAITPKLERKADEVVAWRKKKLGW
jgi:hypothetical protein